MACGRTGAVTHLAKIISLFFVLKKGHKTRALLSFAALQDRLALLLGYVKNDVVTLDSSPCSGLSRRPSCRSPSRAPETHRAILHLLQSPPVGRTTAPFLSSWPWLVPRCARCWCPKVASPGRLWCASHAGPYVRIPRSARPLHPLDNINMLPIRADTINRHWQRPTVTGIERELA